MTAPLLNTLIGIGTSLAILAALYSPLVRRSRLWTITVTPLASIIGSGFLISAPLLYAHFGTWAVPAVIAINGLALAVGLVIRHNIQYFDIDRPGFMERSIPLRVLGRLSGAMLSVAYVVSVAFYITLMSGFALESLGMYRTLWVKLASTAALAAIGAYGYARGLHGLERVEKVAVNLKIAIIGGLLVVLAVFRIGGGGAGFSPATPHFGLASLAVLGGMLLITQGFETTKYLGHQYAVKPRVRALVLAQLIAAGIYVAFVGLVGPLVEGVDPTRETAIIEAIARLALGLGIVLSFGAIFSQFSAAVADTVGVGGIVEQESRGRVKERLVYPAVALAAMALVWGLDVFSVMAFASRAFALYYALQASIATLTAIQHPESPRRSIKLVLFPVLAVVLLLIALFAVPAEEQSVR